MRKILQKILKIFAKMILKKYNPEIIGITGSVGKTSTKEAVSVVLKKFGVQENKCNYNNEIGVPLAIIGAKSAGKNIFGWIAIFARAKKLIFFKDKKYPKLLVLELAVDKPQDMDYLLDFVKPKIGILTRIGPVHLENFKSQKGILEEKSKLIKSLPKGGFAILNYDYKDVYGLCDVTEAKCITYGFDEGALLRAKNIIISKGQASFTLEYKDKRTHVIMLNFIGKAQVYAILAGFAVGVVKGMSLDEMKEQIKNYIPPKGRGVLVGGIKQSTIIDDTYNASPQSMEEALLNLKALANNGRSIAVLGDMLELGSISDDAHMEIGRYATSLGVNYIFTVGMRAKDIAKGAKAAGMAKDKIHSFDNNKELGKFLEDKIEKGDTILVKGSRGMKMEDIINEIKEI